MSAELKQVEKLFRQLLAKEYIKFPKARGKLLASKEKGVYIICNSRGTIEHVGRTPRAKEGIYQRLNQHLNSRSSYVEHHLDGKGSKLRRGHSFKYLPVKNDRIRALLEAYCVAHLCPKHLGLSIAQ